jgi:tripartite-type tricarboxylate transporter receptor subunit TctC
MYEVIGRLVGAFVLFLPALVSAQSDYPNKPIRMLAGFPPGGSADAIARVTGDAMSKDLGQPVIVENKPGAGSTIASEFVARAAPDGYTVYLGSASMFGADRVLYKGIKYDGYRDFAPITLLAEAPLIVAVNKSLDVANLQELIAKAKGAPDKIFYASSGNGTAPHLAGVYFNKLAGTRLTHVPFKGGSPSVQSVMANDTQVVFATPPTVLPAIQSGLLRALAVTQSKRSPLFPNIPSADEAGLPGFEHTFWFGLFGPAKMPQPVVDKLFSATTKALADPGVKEKLARQGMHALPSKSVEDFKQKIAKDGPEQLRLTQESGATAD